MLSVENLQKCHTYSEALKLIGIGYNTKASKEKLFKICHELGFDFENHLLAIKKSKQENINKHYCLNCGKEIDIILDPNKKNRKFCSRSCATSYTNRLRGPRSQEVRQKISNTLKTKNVKTNKIEKYYYKYGKHRSSREDKFCYICGQKKCDNLEVCKHMLSWFDNLIPFGFNIKTIKTVDVYKEYYKVKDLLEKEYFDNQLSIGEIKRKYNYPYSTERLVKVFKSMSINLRSLSDATQNAIKNERLNIPTNSFSHYKCGWHTTWDNRQVFLRSSYELDYAQELDQQQIYYEVEYFRISYWDNNNKKFRIAIPDFYLPDSQMIVEIKSIYTLQIDNMVDKIKAYKELGFNVKLICEHKEIDIKKLQ